MRRVAGGVVERLACECRSGTIESTPCNRSADRSVDTLRSCDSKLDEEHEANVRKWRQIRRQVTAA